MNSTCRIYKGVGPVWVFSISLVYTGLLLWIVPQSQKVNLTYCLKSSLFLTFSFCLFVWLIRLKCSSHLSHHSDFFRRSYVICVLICVICVWSYVIFIVWTLLLKWLGFLENHRRRDQDFLVKMGGVAHIGGGCL